MASDQTTLQRGMTLLEVLIIIAVLCFLAATLLPALSRTGRASNQRRIVCLTNLKQIGLGFDMFAGDHHQKFPMQVSTNEGGSREYLVSEDLFRHFAAVSEQLVTPRMLTCPVDPLKERVTDFSRLANRNISYFLGLDSVRGEPNSFLSGDRTLTIRSMSSPGTVLLATNSVAKWAEGIHYRSKQFLPGREFMGQVAFADGSVRRLSQTDLAELVKASSPATNRIMIP